MVAVWLASDSDRVWRTVVVLLAACGAPTRVVGPPPAAPEYVLHGGSWKGDGQLVVIQERSRPAVYTGTTPRLDERNAITGTVFEDGEPFPGAAVFATSQPFGSAAIVEISDEDGRYRIVVDPGTYRVTAYNGDVVIELGEIVVPGTAFPQ